jgi:hypothetical protein
MIAMFWSKDRELVRLNGWGGQKLQASGVLGDEGGVSLGDFDCLTDGKWLQFLTLSAVPGSHSGAGAGWGWSS